MGQEEQETSEIFARLAAEKVGKTGQTVASRKVISDAVSKVNSLIFGFKCSHLSP
jgi:hypothetical protein